MKNFIALLLLCTTIFSNTNIYSVYADEQIKIFIDGEQLITDDTPFLTDGRTLVPFRAIFEKLFNYDAMIRNYKKYINSIDWN